MCLPASVSNSIKQHRPSVRSRVRPRQVPDQSAAGFSSPPDPWPVRGDERYSECEESMLFSKDLDGGASSGGEVLKRRSDLLPLMFSADSDTRDSELSKQIGDRTQSGASRSLVCELRFPSGGMCHWKFLSNYLASFYCFCFHLSSPPETPLLLCDTINSSGVSGPHVDSRRRVAACESVLPVLKPGCARGQLESQQTEMLHINLLIYRR